MGTERRREPWPWLVGALLAAMIATSLAFFWTAVTHPDPPVVDDAYRAGLDYARRMQAPGPAGE